MQVVIRVNGYFNPRPRVEGDLLCSSLSSIACLFQSSPSCGGRLIWYGFLFPFSRISILALVWRATPDRERQPEQQQISILALVWRATFAIAFSVSILGYFNPRPRVEGDILFEDITQIRLFQSSPSCGGRPGT